MCSIFKLIEGYTLPYNLLHNAMHNNEHGYGIVLKDNTTKKSKLISELTDEPDVDKVYKILKDNEDIERWVHLRNQSAGKVSKENVQPFHVYHSKSTDVWFCHNGTIYTDALKYFEGIKEFLPGEIKPGEDSDSRIFGLTKIAPFLQKFNGNIRDPFFIQYMMGLWQIGFGKGVLISNNSDPLVLNPDRWEYIDDGGGNKFFASNDDYFKTLKRGKLYDKQEAERKAKELRNRVSVYRPENSNDSKIVDISSSQFMEYYKISDDFKEAIGELDLYSDEHYAMLCFLSYSEILELFKTHTEDASVLFMQIVDTLKEKFVEIDALKRKLKELEEKEPEEIIEGDVHVG